MAMAEATKEFKDVLSNQDIHFTYKEYPDMNLLCQGDVLEKTDELATILEKIHPYFLKPEYKYFMVLSQSCDLVRRNGKPCKTPYITLAAVREYSDFFKRILISRKMAEEHNGFLLVEEKAKIRVTQLVERIYNNTEPDYFFLYKEEALDFPKSMVTYLKVSIALKSELHYEVCLKAKKLELSDEFKAKLGWLIGNMYSRVGTTDWESRMTDKARRQMIEDDVKSRCVIGAREQIKELKRNLKENSDILDSHDAVMEYLSSIVVKSKYDQVMEIIEEIFNTTCKNIDSAEKKKLLNAIKSRSKIKTLIG